MNRSISQRLRFGLYLVPALFAQLAIGSLAAADVDVRGGSPLQHHVIDSVYDAVIPAQWRTNAVVKVNILSDQEMNSYIREGSDDHMASTNADDSIDGIFENKPPTITLRGSTDSIALPFTFAHEYGHYFWQSVLTGQDRAKYAEIYDRQKRAHHLVTDYAACELDEGFAEAFSYYVVSKAVLIRKDAVSCKFLDDILARSQKPVSGRA